ncbi:MAG TPA: hypothetical protein VIB48_00285 [Acidimicrobiia bacterium]|jgi:hypothetical protein
MRVLVLETQAGVAASAAERLEASGHEVLRCHEQSQRHAFPCAGLAENGGCPLDGPGVDVALTVRHEAMPEPADLEDGVACALRAHVPLVVAGDTSFNPYASYDATVVNGADVVDVCEQVANAPLQRHGMVALDALRASLTRHGVADAEVEAIVYRSRDGLKVTLLVPADAPDDAAALATTRVVGALRNLDRNAHSIDVAMERLPG